MTTDVEALIAQLREDAGFDGQKLLAAEALRSQATLITRLKSMADAQEQLIREHILAQRAAEAKCAELERDAGRYRRIRLGISAYHGDVYAMVFDPEGDYPVEKDDLDSLLDAIIAAQAGSKEG